VTSYGEVGVYLNAHQREKLERREVKRAFTLNAERRELLAIFKTATVLH
jgi:hypothetical protein